jgi:hypothetical protein
VSGNVVLATPAMVAAIDAAVRPPREPRPIRIDPERAAAGKPPRVVRAHTRPARDNSRVSLAEIDASGAVVLRVPARAARDGTAAETLKLAQDAAPGVAIKVARGRRVLAQVAASSAPVVVPAPAPMATPPAPADPGKPAAQPGKGGG